MEPEPTLVIEPSRGFRALDLRELWKSRELLFILAGRDVRLRYKQTALGIFWVVLQPLAAALLFAAIFGRLAHLPSDGAPYTSFVFAGLLPWTLLSGAVQRSATSLVADSRLVSKVYFPRLLIPLSSAAAVLIDFGVSLLVMAALMAVQSVAPTVRLLTLPFFLLLALAAAVGLGLWLSALNVRYRDFMYALPFLLQVWMFASPVAWPTSLVPVHLRTLIALNPAVGIIEGFRFALLGRGVLSLPMLAVSTATSLALLLSGALFFRRVERSFADSL